MQFLRLKLLEDLYFDSAKKDVDLSVGILKTGQRSLNTKRRRQKAAARDWRRSESKRAHYEKNSTGVVDFFSPSDLGSRVG
jgi:hypothetical protein